MGAFAGEGRSREWSARFAGGLFWKGLRSVCLRVDLAEMEGRCGRMRTGDEGWGRIAEGCYGKRMLSDWARSGFGGDRGFNRSTHRI